MDCSSEFVAVKIYAESFFAGKKINNFIYDKKIKISLQR